MKPSFKRKLDEVLGHPTIEKELVKADGGFWKAEVVERVRLASTGSVQATKDNQYRYSIVDINNNLEYEIKAPQKIDVKFGTVLEFKNLIGGSFDNGGTWFKADSVSVVER